MEKAIEHLSKLHAEFDFNKLSGSVSPGEISLFSEASQAWAKVEKLNLNEASTSLRAIPNFSDDDSDDRSSRTTSSMPPLVVSTKLVLPRLLKGPSSTVAFDLTRVGDLAAAFITVDNDSGMPMEASLAERVNDAHVFNQASRENANRWWSGNGRFMLARGDTSVLQGSYGKSAHSLDQDFNHEIHGITYALRGCGTRCGLKDEANQGTSVFSSVVGASVDNKGGNDLNEMLKPPMFALRGGATRSVVIPPYSRGRLGPVYFRPWGEGNFKAKIFIRNNVTLLEPVELRGVGVLERLEFVTSPNFEDFRWIDGVQTLLVDPTRGSGFFRIVLKNFGTDSVRFKNIFLGENNKDRSSRHTTESCSHNGVSLPDCVLAKVSERVLTDIHPSLELTHSSFILATSFARRSGFPRGTANRATIQNPRRSTFYLTRLAVASSSERSTRTS